MKSWGLDREGSRQKVLDLEIATLLQRSLRVAAECDNGDGPWLISGAFQVKDG